MKTFRVTVTNQWLEQGSVDVEANTEDEARDMVRELLLDGSDEIQWGSMDHQGEDIEDVREKT